MYDLMDLVRGSLGFILIVLLICYIFAIPFFTSWLASQKGYSGVWFLLGLIFGILAFLAIGFAPDKNINEIASTVDSLKKSLKNQNTVKTNNNDEKE